MGSQSSSSGWFKQAEQLEQERKSGSVPPPPQRVPPRPPPRQEPAAARPSIDPPQADPPAPDETPSPAPGPTAVSKRPTPPAPVESVAAAPPPPRPTPKASVTLPDLPNPGTKTMLRSPFHKPPASYRRPDAPDAKPSPPATAAPAVGRFSLVPDGTGHRLVYARPGDAGGLAPVVVGRLTVPELRQLAATLARYLGAVAPHGPPGSTPDLALDKPAPTTGS